MDYVIDNDVVITLYEASKRGMRHPLLGWVKRHRGRIVFSELTRDELRDMERRGKLCPDLMLALHAKDLNIEASHI